MKYFLPVLILFSLCWQSHAQVLINETLGSTTGSDSEFIELYNNGVNAVDLSNWSIKIYESDSGSFFGEEDTDILIPMNTTLESDEFYLIANAQFQTSYQVIPDLAIPDNSIENSSYTIILKDENGVRQNSIFVTDGGAGDQANDMGTVITPDLSFGPDGTFLPAGFYRTTDGGGTLGLLDFSPNPSNASTPKYTNSETGNNVVTASVVSSLSEPSGNGSIRLSLLTQAAPVGGVLVNYTLSGTATLGSDYSDTNGGSITIPSGSQTATVNLSVIDDNLNDPDETIILTITSVGSGYSIGAAEATLIILDDESGTGSGNTTLISTIQGSGSSSPLVGATVTVEAIVVGDFQGGSASGINGFFIQEEDMDADGDAATSEGVFVFDRDLSPNVDVQVGDKVRVVAMVNEFSDNTELVPSSITVLSNNNPLPSKSNIDLPLPSVDDYEAFEGMRVQFVDQLFVTEYFNLDRFGEIRLAEGGRFENFTECNEPDEVAFNNYQADLEARSITLDDGRSGQNLPPRLPDGTILTPNNLIRGNDIVTNLCGVLDFRFGDYRVQPTAPAHLIANNPRPTTTPNVGGNITVASVNVLNYFNGDGMGGGFPTSRGARSFSDFQRQSLKISIAICELEADIIGIQEIENDGFGAKSAIQNLVDDIAAECGLNYGFVDPGTNEVGEDDIAVGLLYNTATIAEVGTAAILESPVDIFIGSGTNRAILAQTFEVIDNNNPDDGEKLTIAVNHFKSKGSACGVGDDETDGSGNCNETRRRASEALANWLATDPTNSQVADQMIIGDLNSYRKEDPIEALEDAGYTNLIPAFAAPSSFPCGGDYSFVFDGRYGSLDYALANQSLFPDVTGAANWHVNVDESDALDYRTVNANDPSLFEADEFRFSDHDPVIVGLDLNTQTSSSICNISIAVNDDPIANGTYQATTISSKGTVQSGSTVVFQAESSIVLRPGFHAEPNFTARIGNCTNNANDIEERTDNQLVEAVISSLTLSPNPVLNDGVLRVELAYDSAIQIELLDLNAKRIDTLFEGKLDKGVHQLNVQFGQLTSSGYYLIRMTTARENITLKLIK